MADEKILENEKLDDEQLEQVAGGSITEMEGDSQNFKRLNVFSGNVNDRDKQALRTAFAAYGISVELHGGHAKSNRNKYFLNGQEIPRDVAWFHVQTQWNQGNRPHIL